MNILKRGAVALSVLAMAGTTAGLVAASAASAAPPPPHVIKTTTLTTSDVHLSPFVEVIRDANYQPQVNIPGFKEVSTTLEVCASIPHVVPPLPLTPTAICTWRVTTTGPAPHSTLSGTAFKNGDGQVGRVTGGTGIWAGAHSAPLPVGFLSQNLAPKVAADTFTFFL
jgi:hypothetical protein